MSEEHDNRLVPYTASSRAVVLRHGNALVLYNEDSQSVELGYADADDDHAESDICPTCSRPYDIRRASESAESEHGGIHDKTFITPEYFRLLQESRAPSEVPSRAVSPQLRLISSNTTQHSKTSFPAQTPTPPRLKRSTSQRISSAAFSQGYYKTFFVEERELGRGGNGVVFLVRHVINEVDLGRFACKRIPVGDDVEWLRKVLLEVQLLQNLSHQNLVKYNHVWLENAQINSFGPEVPCAFILQQYCNAGDLHHYMFGSEETITKEQLKTRARRTSRGESPGTLGARKPRHLSLEDIFAFFRDITSGLHYLHRNGYVHRDLKPSNCLMNKIGSQLRVLVSDFGEMQDANLSRNSTGNTGTVSFCAPELLKMDATGKYGNFTSKSDIFSLGLIVYLMCFGRLPYVGSDVVTEENEDIDKLKAEISAWTGLDLEQRNRSDLPDKLYRFLRTLLAVDPEERPSTDEILHSIKTGANFYEHAQASGSTSPIKERKDNRAWPFTTNSAHTQPTPTALELRRRPSALVSQRNIEASLTTNFSPSPRTRSPDAADTSPDTGRTFESQQSPRHRDHSFYNVPRLLPAPHPRRRKLTDGLVQLLDGYRLSFMIKSSILCFKVGICLSGCSPAAVNPWITYPLLALAVADLSDTDLLRSIVLMVVHVVVVLVSLQRDILCK